jgi:hypothetical protein
MHRPIQFVQLVVGAWGRALKEPAGDVVADGQPLVSGGCAAKRKPFSMIKRNHWRRMGQIFEHLPASPSPRPSPLGRGRMAAQFQDNMEVETSAYSAVSNGNSRLLLGAGMYSGRRRAAIGLMRIWRKMVFFVRPIPDDGPGKQREDRAESGSCFLIHSFQQTTK